jgi:predicted nucleotidyltransferase
VSEASTSIDGLQAPVAVATALGHVSDELQAAAGDNLVALVLFGGLARGRHRGPRSDVDLAVVLEDASPARIGEIAPVLLAAWRVARVEPWILGRAEIPRLAEVFPTKLLDIREHHLVLRGEDVFAGVVVEPRLLRLRVEQELTNLSLRLRRNLVSLSADGPSMAAYLVGVARPLAIQLAALLRVAGRRVPGEDRSAAIYAEAAAAFDLDGEALARIAELRQGDGAHDHGREATADDVVALFGRVQAAVTRAAEVAAALEVP